jgi:hypothetical protein
MQECRKTAPKVGKDENCVVVCSLTSEEGRSEIISASLLSTWHQLRATKQGPDPESRANKETRPGCRALNARAAQDALQQSPILPGLLNNTAICGVCQQKKHKILCFFKKAHKRGQKRARLDSKGQTAKRGLPPTWNRNCEPLMNNE